MKITVEEAPKLNPTLPLVVDVAQGTIGRIYGRKHAGYLNTCYDGTLVMKLYDGTFVSLINSDSWHPDSGKYYAIEVLPRGTKVILEIE